MKKSEESRRKGRKVATWSTMLGWLATIARKHCAAPREHWERAVRRKRGRRGGRGREKIERERESKWGQTSSSKIQRGGSASVEEDIEDALSKRASHITCQTRRDEQSHNGIEQCTEISRPQWRQGSVAVEDFQNRLKAPLRWMCKAPESG